MYTKKPHFYDVIPLLQQSKILPATVNIGELPNMRPLPMATKLISFKIGMSLVNEERNSMAVLYGKKYQFSALTCLETVWYVFHTELFWVYMLYISVIKYRIVSRRDSFNKNKAVQFVYVCILFMPLSAPRW